MRKLIIFIILIIGAWTAYWVYAKSAIVTGAQEKIAQFRTQGYDIEHKPLAVSGYPLSFKTDAGPVTIIAPKTRTGNAGLKARLEIATFTAAAYAPTAWTLSHTGAGQFDIPVAGTRWTFDTQSAGADIKASAKLSGELSALGVIARDVSVTSTGADAPPVKSVGALDYAFKRKGSGATYKVVAGTIDLVDGAGGQIARALGPQITDLSGVLSVTDYASAAPVYSSDDFALLWGKANLGGNFNLSRSPSGLSGKISLNVNEEQALISDLTSKGILSPGESMIAGLMIGNLPKTEDGRRQITLAVVNNVVSLGPIKLGRLPF